MIEGERKYEDNQYFYLEDPIVMCEAWQDGSLQWANLSSGHTGCNCSVDFFQEFFYLHVSQSAFRSRMQSVVDSYGYQASKQSNCRDRGLISSLPVPYFATSLLYADLLHGLPRLGGYDSCLVVTCGLSCFTRAFPEQKHHRRT